MGKRAQEQRHGGPVRNLWQCASRYVERGSKTHPTWVLRTDPADISVQVACPLQTGQLQGRCCPGAATRLGESPCGQEAAASGCVTLAVVGAPFDCAGMGWAGPCTNARASVPGKPTVASRQVMVVPFPPQSPMPTTLRAPLPFPPCRITLLPAMSSAWVVEAPLSNAAVSPPARKPAKYSDDEGSAGEASSSGDEDDDEKPLAAKGRAKAAAKKTPASAGAKKPVVRGKVGGWRTGQVAAAERSRCMRGGSDQSARDESSWETSGGGGIERRKRRHAVPPDPLLLPPRPHGGPALGTNLRFPISPIPSAAGSGSVLGDWHLVDRCHLPTRVHDVVVFLCAHSGTFSSPALCQDVAFKDGGLGSDDDDDDDDAPLIKRKR